MAKVTFLPANTTVEVEPGTLMLDAARANGVQIITGCTMGICCTDPCRVVEGIENLEPKTPEEEETLSRFPDNANVRLSCQAIINGDCVVEVNVDQ